MFYLGRIKMLLRLERVDSLLTQKGSRYAAFHLHRNSC